MTDGNDVSITYGQCEVCATTGTSNIIAESVELNVFPNPTSDFLNVSSNQIFNRISIIDIIGAEVASVIPNSVNTIIDLSSLSPGIYFLNGITKDNRYTKQVIVK